MKLERQQIMLLYMKIMKKFYKLLRDLASNEIHSSVPHFRDVSLLLNYCLQERTFVVADVCVCSFQIAMEPYPVTLEEELKAAAKQVEVCGSSCCDFSINLFFFFFFSHLCCGLAHAVSRMR